MWKFIVDVVHDLASSLQPDVGRGFLHVSNVFLFYCVAAGNTAFVEVPVGLGVVVCVCVCVHGGGVCVCVCGGGGGGGGFTPVLFWMLLLASFEVCKIFEAQFLGLFRPRNWS